MFAAGPCYRFPLQHSGLFPPEQIILERKDRFAYSQIPRLVPQTAEEKQYTTLEPQTRLYVLNASVVSVRATER